MPFSQLLRLVHSVIQVGPHRRSQNFHWSNWSDKSCCVLHWWLQFPTNTRIAHCGKGFGHAFLLSFQISTIGPCGPFYGCLRLGEWQLFEAGSSPWRFHVPVGDPLSTQDDEQTIVNSFLLSSFHLKITCWKRFRISKAQWWFNYKL